MNKKRSARALRMERHQGRMKKTSKLNLVSLMDIFTILVFFLLVNSSEVEVLQNEKSITLPESTAEQRPNETIVVMVNNENILVGGRVVASISNINSETHNIDPLAKELKYQSERRPELSEEEKIQGRAITIMGDQSVPYALLKKVMHTCASNDYRQISLAVTQVPIDETAFLEEADGTTTSLTEAVEG